MTGKGGSPVNRIGTQSQGWTRSESGEGNWLEDIRKGPALEKGSVWTLDISQAQG